MRRFANRFLLLPLGWLALAYLGFWLAWCIDHVLLPLVVFPFTGERISDWILSPFFLSLSFTHDHSHANFQSGVRSATMLLEIVLLVALTARGARVRSAARRVWLHFAGLWIVLLMALGLAQWFAAGRGDMGQLFRLLGKTSASATWVRWSAGLPIILFLFFAAAVCARRLIADLRANCSTLAGTTWLPPIALAALVELIVWGASGFQWRWLASSDLRLLFAPGLGALLLGTLGLWRVDSEMRRSELGARAAAAAILFAAALCASALATPRFRSWNEERKLERLASAHYDIRYPAARFTSAAIQTLASEREKLLAADAARLGVSLDSVHLTIILYGDFPSERRATRNHLPFAVEGATIRAALTGYVHDVDPVADASALLNTTWGKPGSPLLGDWVARWLAGDWRDRPIEAWASQIESEVGHHTIRELFEGVPVGELSPYVARTLGAAWIAWAHSRGGIGAVRKLFAGPAGPLGYEQAPAALGLTPSEFEARWSEWLIQLAAKYPPPAAATRSLPSNFYLRGISFEDALSLDGGYSSPAAAAQIRTLHQIGANAIALVPYGFVDNTSGGMVSYTRTGETDEGVSEAAYQAHQLGMKVMLKPQLWVRWGQFSGRIHFDSDGERQRWMQSYREYILHYARLAEMEQIDLLCIGNELEGVTGDEAGWRALIADIRRVYHGPLTYAANWGAEFFGVHFWDALDYAGLNNYYPLAAKPSANIEDLRAGAESLAAELEAFSAQWHKPVLFTEVGYPSVQGAAVEPWAEVTGRVVNLDEQAACYETDFRIFSGRAWLAGMFWWKWRSDGTGGGAADASYSPIHKPAAEVIRGWYTRLENARAKLP